MRARQKAAIDTALTLGIAVRRFVNERENPAPDLTMRRIEYERMIEALDAFEATQTARLS